MKIWENENVCRQSFFYVKIKVHSHNEAVHVAMMVIYTQYSRRALPYTMSIRWVDFYCCSSNLALKCIQWGMMILGIRWERLKYASPMARTVYGVSSKKVKMATIMVCLKFHSFLMCIGYKHGQNFGTIVVPFWCFDHTYQFLHKTTGMMGTTRGEKLHRLNLIKASNAPLFQVATYRKKETLGVEMEVRK